MRIFDNVTDSISIDELSEQFEKADKALLRTSHSLAFDDAEMVANELTRSRDAYSDFAGHLQPNCR